MSCVSNLSSGLRSLSADSATGTPSWITPARPCAGLTHIDVALVISQVVGNARVAVVVDFFTTDPNKPTSRVTVGSPVTASAKLSRDLTTDAQNNAFYRVGLLPSLSSGTTPGSIGVSLTGSVKSCGMVLARETVVVGPIPVGTQQVFDLTGLFPARQFATVQAVVRVIGKSGTGTLRTRLMSRTC